jgi:uncharacterized protein YjbJ (UPF0337 family)
MAVDGFAGAEVGTSDRMSHDNEDTAAEARKGLIAGVVGKAREIAGAATGNDDLAEKGRLQQAEAKHRKDAVAEEAIADAKKQKAAEDLREANHETAAEREAAQDRADKAQRAVDGIRDAEHADAERIAAEQEAIERRAAEQRADDVAAAGINEAEGLAADASSTEQQATSDRARLEQEATIAEQQAARLRDQARSEK